MSYRRAFGTLNIEVMPSDTTGGHRGGLTKGGSGSGGSGPTGPRTPPVKVTSLTQIFSPLTHPSMGVRAANLPPLVIPIVPTYSPPLIPYAEGGAGAGSGGGGGGGGGLLPDELPETDAGTMPVATASGLSLGKLALGAGAAYLVYRFLKRKKK